MSYFFSQFLKIFTLPSPHRHLHKKRTLHTTLSTKSALFDTAYFWH